MLSIKNDTDLQAAILELENRKHNELAALHEQWDHTKQNLNPLSIIKDGALDLFRSPDVKSGALKGMLSLATGFLTKKLIVGNAGGVTSKIVGALAQTGATSLAYKGTNAIQEKGASFLSGLLKKMKIGK